MLMGRLTNRSSNDFVTHNIFVARKVYIDRWGYFMVSILFSLVAFKVLGSKVTEEELEKSHLLWSS